jgi:glycosyltransferase involved in cell wall biosynthesis
VLVAVSGLVRDEVIATGVPAEKVVVVNNGVDVEEFSSGQGRRLAFGLPEKVPIALFAGDIRTRRKNLDTVLRALALVPSLHLAVAGTLDESPFPTMAKDLGVAERVHFLGFQRNMVDVMRSSDFMVFPSRYEPFGLVVLEAMAVGLPVITAESTGSSSLVRGEAGIVLKSPEAVEELAAAMQTLGANTELRVSMGQKARLIAERYTFDKMAASYVDLLEHRNKKANFGKG